MKVSIVTINYNDKEGLEQTLESIVSQTSQDYELIVIDAASTDGSIDVIHKYEKYITYWCSEKDNGRYDGMNKGIRKATCEYTNFMNSGDCFENEHVLEDIQKDLCIGAAVVTGKVRNYKENYVEYREAPKESDLNMFYFWTMTLSHQASFIRTKYLKKYEYDTSLNIVADWKLFVRLIIIEGLQYKHSDVLVANCNMYGVSSIHENRFKEREKVYYQLLPAKVVEDYKKMYNLSFMNDLSYLITDTAKGKIRIHKIFKAVLLILNKI